MNDHDQVPARDPTDVAELLGVREPLTSPRAAERLPEPRGLFLVALATFTAGSCVGWLFRQELLNPLIMPWRDPPMIIDSPPYGPLPGEVHTWYVLLMAAVALLASLPFLSWLTWRVSAPRTCPATFGTAFAFVSSSYLVIAFGLWLAARFAFPAFVDQEHLRWRTPFGLRPVPWAYVELELKALIAVALTSQACTVALAFVWAHFTKPSRALGSAVRHS